MPQCDVTLRFRIKEPALPCCSHRKPYSLQTSSNMKVFALILVATIIVAVQAQQYSSAEKPYRASPKQKYEDEEEYPPGPPKPYQFGYKIDDQETYSNYQRHETSDGEVVTGSYRVALPDGRTQTVTYKAGGTGGNIVEVTYEGEAVYPEEVPEKKEAYPRPTYSAKPEYKAAPKYVAPKYDAPKYEAPAKYDAPEY